MENVDHIGIAVRNLDEQIIYYTDVLGLPLLKIEEVVTEQVRVAFIDAGNTHIELLEPMSEESAIFKFIEKRGEGIHHVALGVTGIESKMTDLREQGVRLLSDEPRPGAGGSKMAFIHPKSSNGVLYELYDKSESKE
ncbi:methylmalonyl-CoA epimerase [Viridibacillus sp. YIM B01967]|uniref:Methylmalonyl-CoA epimerase n=1 Tax=Viridibacillus soli TaxID=2798301 RepID=A0ABS1H3V8_9BACL|nr:methylmalonyl-CoA epimerase [Viridibacillus soli]MBK3494108.1 methylmalonyl-CoA epimerase [Viridibacillus soli]